MPDIVNIRCVLLSSPYADADDPEIKECFPNGPKRTIGGAPVLLASFWGPMQNLGDARRLWRESERLVGIKV